ncbi:MAG: alkaline phytoceramidase [Thermoanaerobaculia bacterium]
MPTRKPSLPLRGVLLLTVAAVAIVGVALHGPIPQPSGYHDFADGRSLGRIPHFADTLSNLPFLLVGVAGLTLFWRRTPPGALPALRPAYLAFLVGTALLFPGSAYYHLAPTDSTLAWDRLPMTLAFMAVFAIIIGEHISPRLGIRLLLPLLLFGALSVWYWRATDSGNGGDLRLYVLVQYLPMLLIPVIVLLYRSALAPTSYLWALLGSYGAAKALEFLDAPVFRMTGFVSGHTLKHLAAALGVYFLYLGFIRRRPAPAEQLSAEPTASP